MQTMNTSPGRVRQKVNNLVVVEIFLIQATIESATVLGEGFNVLGKHLSRREEGDQEFREPLSVVMQRIADEALEPYTSRFRYLRNMNKSDQ